MSGVQNGLRPTYSADPNSIIQGRVHIDVIPCILIRDPHNVVVLPERAAERIVQVVLADMQLGNHLIVGVPLRKPLPLREPLEYRMEHSRIADAIRTAASR